MQLTLVTGNKNKLEEWRRLAPSDIDLQSSAIDLPEIQSLSVEEVVTDKAKRAYAILNKPVIVEDISVTVDCLNGLPGPFIKFFVSQLGNDCLVTLAGRENEGATVSCAIAYYDGTNEIVVKADVRGKCVKPKGKNGFGFDFGFMPDGYNKTYAEMTPAQKDKVSHRMQAIKMLLERLASD